jgi:hypothetical protein
VLANEGGAFNHIARPANDQAQQRRGTGEL